MTLRHIWNLKMKYRKKPVVIEAKQLTKESFFDILEWMGKDQYSFWTTDTPSYISINTLEGVMRASLNDFIIKGVQGEFYPCKPDIFEQTYEALTNEE